MCGPRSLSSSSSSSLLLFSPSSPSPRHPRRARARASSTNILFRLHPKARWTPLCSRARERERTDLFCFAHASIVKCKTLIGTRRRSEKISRGVDIITTRAGEPQRRCVSHIYTPQLQLRRERYVMSWFTGRVLLSRAFRQGQTYMYIHWWPSYTCIRNVVKVKTRFPRYTPCTAYIFDFCNIQNMIYIYRM